MSQPNFKVPLTNESIVSIIHTGHATHSKACEEWINVLKTRWNVDIIACYGESISYLSFAKQKKRFSKIETLIPESMINDLCITMYYRMTYPEDYTRSQQNYTEIDKEFLAVLEKHSITPQFVRVLTLDERRYFGIQDTDRNWRDVWSQSVQKLQISPVPQLQVRIYMKPFETLVMLHLYGDTRALVEKYFQHRFADKVRVRVFQDESTHYIIFDSKEFLDQLISDKDLYDDVKSAILNIVKKKDLWNAVEVCGYHTVFQTMDGLSNEQRWVCMRQ